MANSTRNLRSKQRADQLLTNYKNSKLKRTVNLKECNSNSFMFQKEPLSTRISYINAFDQNKVNSKKLQQKINLIAKRTNQLITGLSSDFLLERTVLRAVQENIGEKITVVLKYLHVNDNEIEKLSCKLSKTSVQTNDTTTLNDEPEGMSCKDATNHYGPNLSVCLDLQEINDCTENSKTSAIFDSKSEDTIYERSFESGSAICDVLINAYCALCGKSETYGKRAPKRKHSCDNNQLEMHKKLTLGNLNINNNFENHEIPLDIEECATEKVLFQNEINKNNFSSNMFTSLYIQQENIENKSSTPPKLTTSCSIQTSTPISAPATNDTACNTSVPVTNDIACNTSTGASATNDIACNTSLGGLDLIIRDSKHNDTQSFLESPRMKKILDILDRRYACVVPKSSSLCQNSSKPNLATIDEVCNKQNAQGMEICSENSCKVQRNNMTPPGTFEIGDDEDNFEPDCINNNSINYIFGENFYGARSFKMVGLRVIIIDGSNVAFGHSKGRHFSTEGLRICIDYFLKRGHKVKAFVPQFRLKQGYSTNPKLLKRLYKLGHVVFTPSREVNGQRIVSYDDRFIVQCAAMYDGIIVSSDNYRDLIKENVYWRKIIQENLLMPTWVDDIIIFPPDPLGRYGPTLDAFLRYPANRSVPR